MNSKAVFVSDLHLVSGEDEKAKTFVRFLNDLYRETQSGSAEALTHLFLVGDIFDLWVGAHDYFVDRFKAVVSAIDALVRAGVQVHYFEGNHDLHLTRFWRDHLGVSVHPESGEFEINGQTVRVEHGDLINPDDKGYLFLRGFLRSRVLTFLSLNLPDRAVKAIGERASKASRNYTSNVKAKGKPQEQIRALIRAHAESQFRLRPFDLIITGHVHVTDDFSFPASGKEIRSVNLGSWFDGPKAFVIDAQGARFIELESASS